MGLTAQYFELNGYLVRERSVMPGIKFTGAHLDTFDAAMIVLALIVLALCQLYYLHRGLKLVSTSVLYPLVFCVYNIIAILDGLIYFDQTSLISPLKGCLIALGTVILLSGVMALSWRLSEEQHTPGVGQSTLAPGLGLIEDTEGEEESLLGSESAAEYDAPRYDTFASTNGEETPLTPTRRKSLLRRQRFRHHVLWRRPSTSSSLGAARRSCPRPRPG